MKILIATFLNPYDIKPTGGAETSCRLLAEQLAKRGHTVLYLVNHADYASRQKAKAAGVSLYGLLQLKGNRFSIIQKLSEQRWKLAFKYLCWRFQIDLVYCLYALPIVLAAVASKNILGHPKVVMRMAGLRWYVIAKRSTETALQYQEVFSRVDSINYISQGLIKISNQKLQELELNPSFSHSRVLDIGSPVSIQEKRKEPQRKTNHFNIIMASRFAYYQKRQDLLIKAMTHFSPKNKIHLTLVGEGPLLEPMRQLVNDLGVAESITFLPFLEQRKLMDVFEGQDLLCHSCEYEGLGKIIVEAMARGLPVLASNVEPLCSYIQEGENGFLVSNTSHAWAKRIHELSQSPKDLSYVSKGAINYASDNWDPAKNVLKYEAYFKDLIEK